MCRHWSTLAYFRRAFRCTTESMGFPNKMERDFHMLFLIYKILSQNNSIPLTRTLDCSIVFFWVPQGSPGPEVSRGVYKIAQEQI